MSDFFGLTTPPVQPLPRMPASMGGPDISLMLASQLLDNDPGGGTMRAWPTRPSPVVGEVPTASAMSSPTRTDTSPRTTRKSPATSQRRTTRATRAASDMAKGTKKKPQPPRYPKPRGY